MRVAVTGASGMIGSTLLRRLQQCSGLEVFALCRHGDISQSKTKSGLVWMQGDLQSPTVCRDFVSDADVVFHLAHPSIPLSTSAGWVTATLGSVQASLNLLDALLYARHPPQLVFVSSGGSVYKGNPSNGGFKESDTCQPTSIYGIEKQTIEHHIRLLAERGAIRTLIFRVANAYGKLLPPSRKQGLVGTAIYQALHGEPIRILGSLDNVRDYVHVEDVCDALMRSFDYDAGYDVFNIGTGIGKSVREVLQAIELSINTPLSMDQTPLPDGQSLPACSILNIEKAAKVLNWRPKIGLLEGIQIMVNSADRNG